MRRLLALVFVLALSLSSVAMASDLSASDASFLFGKEAAATTIDTTEMQETTGQVILILAGTGTLAVKIIPAPDYWSVFVFLP